MADLRNDGPPEWRTQIILFTPNYNIKSNSRAPVLEMNEKEKGMVHQKKRAFNLFLKFWRVSDDRMVVCSMTKDQNVWLDAVVPIKYLKKTSMIDNKNNKNDNNSNSKED